MCGIIGAVNFSGKYAHGMESTIRQLLWADTLRGGDATGLYCLTKDLKVDWAKQVVDGWSFCARNERAKAILRVAEEHPFIIGHNRAATSGDHKNVDYAHPIVIENKIGLVHNGTLTGWPQRHLAEKDKIEHDSTAIATIISEEGVQEFINKCYGAWSLAWHDVEKGTLNLYRNEDRPMSVVHTENAVFFGSELGLLMWVIQRNNFKPLKHYYTKPNHLYSFEVGEPEPKVEKIERKYPVHTPYYGNGNRFQPEKSAGYGDSAGRSRSPYHDSYESDDVQRRRSEALRRAKELGERERAAGEEGPTEDTDTGERGDLGNRSKQSNVHSIHGGKPRAKNLAVWKTFGVGQPCMFSIYDYTEIKDHANGQQYNISAEPAVSLDFPEVQIRGVVKVKDLSQEALQASETYFMGEISTIIATDNGNVIMWVKDIEKTETVDPNCKIKGGSKSHEGYFKKRLSELYKDKAGELFNTDEVAEAEIILPSQPIPVPEQGILLTKKLDIKGSEFCQGCGALTPSPKLRFLTETSDDAVTKKEVHHQLRLCEPCVVIYSEDRDKVVPTSIQGQVPKTAQVRKFT